MTTETENDTGTNRRGRVRETASSARNKASETYKSARERTSAAYGSARERAGRASQRTSETLESNPMGALFGGLALGALMAALLPKTRREEEVLGPYGRRINDRAREAARAAKEAGVSKLDELGYNRENAKQKAQSLRGDAKEVASAAAQRLRGDAKEVANAAAKEAKATAQQ